MKTYYEVFDIQTGQTVAGPYSTSIRAYHKSNALDLKYGAINHGIRPATNLVAVRQAEAKRQNRISIREANESCGLTRVRSVSGKIYWE